MEAARWFAAVTVAVASAADERRGSIDDSGHYRGALAFDQTRKTKTKRRMKRRRRRRTTTTKRTSFSRATARASCGGHRLDRRCDEGSARESVLACEPTTRRATSCGRRGASSCERNRALSQVDTTRTISLKRLVAAKTANPPPARSSGLEASAHRALTKRTRIASTVVHSHGTPRSANQPHTRTHHGKLERIHLRPRQPAARHFGGRRRGSPEEVLAVAQQCHPCRYAHNIAPHAPSASSSSLPLALFVPCPFSSHSVKVDSSISFSHILLAFPIRSQAPSTCRCLTR